MSSPAKRREGLDAVNSACRELYPEQPNPYQITAVVKYWLGGPDPLDFISIYKNSGDGSKSVPAHWHYVSCGLSDLYGDGRVHEVATDTGQESGFGFELTFRLKTDPQDAIPPPWPAALMQAVARYVFQSSNALCSGDHISWHQPLDNSPQSPLQHMLLSEDPQLTPLTTSLGSVTFVQIIPVTADELEAAQQWNGTGVMQIMRKHTSMGGEWLVCDISRHVSLFQEDSSAQAVVEEGVAQDGSNLSGVSTMCDWKEEKEKEEEKEEGGGGGDHKESDGVVAISHLHLQLTLEAVALLPLAIKGRLAHHRHFTFKSGSGEKAVTLVTDGVEGAFADEHQPFAYQESWLQVYLGHDFCQDLLHTLQPTLSQSQSSLKLPKQLNWQQHKFSLTILPQINLS